MVMPDHLNHGAVESKLEPAVQIAGRKVGPGSPVFVIAEAGVNHNGELDRALLLGGCGRESWSRRGGVCQTFRAEEVVSASAPKAQYQRGTTGAEESQLQMIKRLRAFRRRSSRDSEPLQCERDSVPFDSLRLR